jgi:hypothetical protein
MNRNSARYRCTADHTSRTQPRTHRSPTVLSFETLGENDEEEMPNMLQNNDGHSPDHELVSAALDEPEMDDEEDLSPDEPRRHVPLEVHLESLSCAMYRNSVRMGAEFVTKVQGILCLFPENSVPFVTVDCDPSVHTTHIIMYVS